MSHEAAFCILVSSIVPNSLVLCIMYYPVSLHVNVNNYSKCTPVRVCSTCSMQHARIHKNRKQTRASSGARAAHELNSEVGFVVCVCGYT
jgi:hypothetical protein